MQEYYLSLVKPSFAPPASWFSPVWTFLYILIIISFSYIIYRVVKGKVKKKILIPLVINLISNLLYTPIMFGLKSNLLASVDILIVLGTIIWLIILTYKKETLFAIAQIPYLLWVSFATILQFSVLFLNGI